MNIGGFGTFETGLFVFVVINKVMHIMNIFVDCYNVFLLLQNRISLLNYCYS